MIAGATAESVDFTHHRPQSLSIYTGVGELIHPHVISEYTSSKFLLNLSILKNKVHQVQSLATNFLSLENTQTPESTAVEIPTMRILVQEIIVTASSMMLSIQQMCLPSEKDGKKEHPTAAAAVEAGTEFFIEDHHESIDHHQWFGDQYNNCNDDVDRRITSEKKTLSPSNYDIIEIDAAYLLAKYTHYCQICDKGFKRDANLRMHMRAHGDEYKSTAALVNPLKKHTSGERLTRKYSCPHEGCRWNKNHTKFQPLKSMICVKNHYKRSHCPKMYVCKKCNRKQFSVLSDLRTHEKHCGDLKWLCSCGTTFSRKDKLLGHVVLFAGHSPMTAVAAESGES